MWHWGGVTESPSHSVAESLRWWRISVTVAIIPATPAVINGFDSYLDEAWGHSGVTVAGPCRNCYQYTGTREVDGFLVCCVTLWKAGGFNVERKKNILSLWWVCLHSGSVFITWTHNVTRTLDSAALADIIMPQYRHCTSNSCNVSIYIQTTFSCWRCLLALLAYQLTHQVWKNESACAFLDIVDFLRE